MDSNYISANIGLSPEQEELCWSMYEKCGSMAEVAKVLEVGQHHVRTALYRDPIRLQHIRECRAEQAVCRWEAREQIAARATTRVMGFIETILDHIDECFAEGKETLLKDPKGRPMSAVEAMQWLMLTRQVESVFKLGATASGIVTSIREHNAQYGVGGTRNELNQVKDPSLMSDAELHQLVADLQSAGRPLPWGVQQWLTAQSSKRIGTSRE